MNIINEPYKHQHYQGQPVLSSWMEKYLCHLRILHGCMCKKHIYFVTGEFIHLLTAGYRSAKTNVKTSGSSGVFCSWVGTVCPCGISWACEVTPGLPQGSVDLRDGSCILHFTWETESWRDVFTWKPLKDSIQSVKYLQYFCFAAQYQQKAWRNANWKRAITIQYPLFSLLSHFFCQSSCFTQMWRWDGWCGSKICVAIATTVSV